MIDTIAEMLKLENDLEQYGLKWAMFDAEARRMDDLSKSVMAQIELEHVGEPVNMREMRARADARYIGHLEGLKEAKALANEYRVKYDTVQAKIEVRRSISALQRAQINLT